MNPIELAQFPHANMRDEKGQPVPITIVKGQVFSWYTSPADKSLHVVAAAGAVVPLLSNSEEFQRILYGKDVSKEEQPKTELKTIKGAKK